MIQHADGQACYAPAHFQVSESHADAELPLPPAPAAQGTRAQVVQDLRCHRGVHLQNKWFDYTTCSKTCGGHMHDKLGSNKRFRRPKCSASFDRDWDSARSIRCLRRCVSWGDLRACLSLATVMVCVQPCIKRLSGRLNTAGWAPPVEQAGHRLWSRLSTVSDAQLGQAGRAP